MPNSIDVRLAVNVITLRYKYSTKLYTCSSNENAQEKTFRWSFYLHQIVLTRVLKPGVTKRCRLSWLTNSALVFEPKCGRGGGGCGVSANEYSCAHRAQINLGDLTPHLKSTILVYRDGAGWGGHSLLRGDRVSLHPAGRPLPHPRTQLLQKVSSSPGTLNPRLVATERDRRGIIL